MKKLDIPANLTTCENLFVFFFFISLSLFILTAGQPRPLLRNLFNMLTARLCNNNVILCILQEVDRVENAYT